MIFGFIVLIVACALSAVSAYYSVLGLVSIFAAAVVPVVVMGTCLEIGKVTAAVWLHKNWKRSPLQYKLYLVPAMVFLMLLTSMGVFGFLSKAHSDQGLVSGDVQAKIAVYDEKINAVKGNIEADRKQLRQMDEAVDQIMSRSTDEKGADKANAVRKSQQRDRSLLLQDIEANQKTLSRLNEEAAPIRAENRKVEAEVGPIKYIAAFIYGDNAESGVLEKAVRWVIILIVTVFDPLAIVLILAGQQQIEWAREEKRLALVPKLEPTPDPTPEPEVETVPEEPAYEPDDGALTEEQIEQLEKSILEQHPYLTKGFVHFTNLKPMVYKPPEETISQEPMVTWPDIEYEFGDEIHEEDIIFYPEESVDIVEPEPEPAAEPEVVTEPEPVPEPAPETAPVITKIQPVVMPETMARPPKPVIQVPEAASNRRKPLAVPDLKLKADNVADDATEVDVQFGTAFPENPNKGDLYLRVDYLPTGLFKFNGFRWMKIDKDQTDTYSYNEEYISYLVERLASGEYDPEDLSNSEKYQIEEFLKKNGQ